MDTSYIESLWSRAAAHFMSAREMISFVEAIAISEEASDVPNFVFNGRYSPSIHLLIAQSLELFLKTAFLCHGGGVVDLKKIGHDLSAALEMAERAGYVSNCAKLKWTVQKMRETHFEHHFRYGDKAKVTLPEFTDSIEVLACLYEEVGVLVYGECDRTRLAQQSEINLP